MPDATEIDLDIGDLERLDDPTVPEIHVPPAPDEPAPEEVVDVLWRGG